MYKEKKRRKMKETLGTLGFMLFFAGAMLDISGSLFVAQGGVSPAAYARVGIIELAGSLIFLAGLYLIVKNTLSSVDMTIKPDGTVFLSDKLCPGNSRAIVFHLSDEFCSNYSSFDSRRVCRKNQVSFVTHLHRLVVNTNLFASSSLDMGS
jgi:hypothetical protein